MKITILGKVTYTDALDMLQRYFETHCKDYPYAAREIKIDLDLVDENDHPYPANDKELVITEDMVEDGSKKEMLELLETTKAYLFLDQEKYAGQLSCVDHRVKMDESYLSTAQEKGRKPEKIAERQEELAKHSKEQEDMRAILSDYTTAANAVKNDEYKARFEVFTNEKWGRKQKFKEVFLDIQVPGFSGSYCISKGLIKRDPLTKV